MKGVHMNTSQVYIAVSIVVFIFFALFFIRENRKERRLTPLAGLSFGFFLAGILFGDERFIGYGLLGVGMVLVVIDMIRKSKSK